jgi:Family of unknown function (DUF5565)
VQKIPTVFRRDPFDMKRVLPEVNPGCEWVLDGEGVATRKYDGTCVMLDGDGRWWARRQVKFAPHLPENYVPISLDTITGKIVGWEPIEQSPFVKFHAEAVSNPLAFDGDVGPGTYELIGPKINGNPEGAQFHVLMPHAMAEVLPDAPRWFAGLCMWLCDFNGEGIVWHHPDGRMAKLKRRDFY